MLRVCSRDFVNLFHLICIEPSTAASTVSVILDVYDIDMIGLVSVELCELVIWNSNGSQRFEQRRIAVLLLVTSRLHVCLRWRVYYF